VEAVELIKQDHLEVEALFKQWEALAGAPEDPERKRSLAERIVRELSMHAAIEEEVLYPAARAALPQGDDLIEESLQEHKEAKEMLLEIDRMSPDDSQFETKVRELIDDVRHHVEEEETKTLPQLRERLDHGTLSDIGEELEKAKKRAPTRPHPKAPDQPPGIKVAGPIAALIDRIRDRAQGRQAG
jgi:hemerythrin-like domain-containing protein